MLFIVVAFYLYGYTFCPNSQRITSFRNDKNILPRCASVLIVVHSERTNCLMHSRNKFKHLDELFWRLSTSGSFSASDKTKCFDLTGKMFGFSVAWTHNSILWKFGCDVWVEVKRRLKDPLITGILAYLYLVWVLGLALWTERLHIMRSDPICRADCLMFWRLFRLKLLNASKHFLREEALVSWEEGFWIIKFWKRIRVNN